METQFGASGKVRAAFNTVCPTLCTEPRTNAPTPVETCKELNPSLRGIGFCYMFGWGKRLGSAVDQGEIGIDRLLIDS